MVSGSFEENKIIYKTAEHYMMAAKARLFNDAEMEKEILKAATPNQAKALGRKVKKTLIRSFGMNIKISDCNSGKSFEILSKSEI